MKIFRKYFILLLFVLISSSIVVFSLDWYLGKYFFIPTKIAARCAVIAAPGIKIFRPNCIGEVFNPDYGRIPFRTNSIGMRDKHYDKSVYQNKGKVIKVLVVGDSFTFGAGVSDEKIFHHLVESRTPDVIFFNAGFGGHGIQEEKRKIDYFLPITNSDMVMLVFLANDLIDLKVPSKGSASAMDRVRVLGNLAALVRDYLLPQELQNSCFCGY